MTFLDSFRGSSSFKSFGFLLRHIDIMSFSNRTISINPDRSLKISSFCFFENLARALFLGVSLDTFQALEARTLTDPVP